MTAVVIGVLWGAVAGWAVLSRSAAAAVRGRRLVPGVGRGPQPSVSTAGHVDTPTWHQVGRLVVTGMQVFESWGRTVRRVAGRAPDPAADRRCGLALVSGLLLLPIHPALAVAPAAAAAVLPRLTARRAARRHTAAVVDELPDVVDLLRLTTSAGLPVTSALRAIGGRPGGVIGAALVRAAARVAHGGTTADTLGVLQHDCGTPVRALVDALADHDRYGTALGPALDRLGLESRLHRRRQAEEAARRLPIALLFPLVLTVLPAFVLLTIIPLLAGSFSSLRP